MFKPKYKLNIENSGFTSEKKRYAEGETVTVRFDMIATDTDYFFDFDGLEYTQSYDGGYVFTFTMPDHDVTPTVRWKNSMVFIPPSDEE